MPGYTTTLLLGIPGTAPVMPTAAVLLFSNPGLPLSNRTSLRSAKQGEGFSVAAEQPQRFATIWLGKIREEKGLAAARRGINQEETSSIIPTSATWRPEISRW